MQFEDLPQRIDLLRFQFVGNALIEASAGTGKTYTLAALYVRLVLGQHPEGASVELSQPLLPSQILVLTFTEAATQELRDRIRSRLTQLADQLERLLAGQLALRDLPDAFDRALAEQLQSRSFELLGHAVQLLQQAAQSMDEAAIYTIHGWCQHALRRFAFQSQSLFEQELLPDLSQVLTDVVHEVWRLQCVGRSIYSLQLLVKFYSSPQSSMTWLRSALKPDVIPTWQGVPLTVIDGDVHQCLAKVDADSQQLAHKVHVFLNDFRSALITHWDGWMAFWDLAESQKLFKANRITTNRLQIFRTALRQLVDAPLGPQAWCSEPLDVKVFEQFTVAQLTAHLKAEHKAMADTLDWPVLHQWIENYLKLCERVASLRIQLLGQVTAIFLQSVRQQFEQKKVAQGLMGFDDLIVRMHKAVNEDRTGQLADRLAQAYPVAMLDEFQDTDAVQYGIFRQIYSSQSDRCCLMIGDPKQAIYGFRGADLDTYFVAKQHTQGRHFTLDTNFRSTSGLVSAVNGLFQQADQRSEAVGAFAYEKQPSSVLPFWPVHAQGRAIELTLNGELVQPMAWGLLTDAGESLNVDEALSHLAKATAAQIAQWIRAGHEGRALLGQEAVQAQHIAVLVRDYREASAIQTALGQWGVRSVYLSDRDSVYNSPQALDLWVLCRSLMNPRDLRALKSALAVPTLGLGWTFLAELDSNDRDWDALIQLWVKCYEDWVRKGILVCIRRLFFALDIPARLMSQPEGERVLTNCMHVAELLQHESQSLDGPAALLDVFEQHILNPSSADEEAVVRLESDENLIRILTYHKSKGLEFPLVFMPFANSHKPLRKTQYLQYKQSGKSHVELDTAVPAQIDAAKLDRHREDIRLFYVALTRPQFFCQLNVAPCQNWADQCVHHVLGGPLDKKDLLGSLRMRLSTLNRLPHVQWSELSRVEPTPQDRIDATLQHAQFAPAPRMRKPVSRQPWWIASYSALRIQSDVHAEAHSERSEVLQEGQEPAAPQNPIRVGIHAFPRGAEAGTLLHNLLEWRLKRNRQIQAESVFEIEVQRQLNAKGWSKSAETVAQWLRQVLNMPLPIGDSPCVLENLPNPVTEMEFWIEARAVPVSDLDGLIRQWIWRSDARPELAPTQLNGMLKGFIDLVFEHEGRYWVCDYKSNDLGGETDRYHTAALKQSMLEHRYDVQAILYCLALYRLLKSRHAEFEANPEALWTQCVGGACYVYLRGIEHPDTRGVVPIQPPFELIRQLDALFCDQSLVLGEGHA